MKIHGKNCIIYLQGSGSDAVELSRAADWSIDMDRDLDANPDLGDDWETAVKGLMRFSGAANGNYDTEDDLVMEAYLQSTSRKFYLYPERSVATKYYYGLVWPVPGIAGGTGSRATFSMAFQGDGDLTTKP